MTQETGNAPCSLRSPTQDRACRKQTQCKPAREARGGCGCGLAGVTRFNAPFTTLNPSPRAWPLGSEHLSHSRPTSGARPRCPAEAVMTTIVPNAQAARPGSPGPTQSRRSHVMKTERVLSTGLWFSPIFCYKTSFYGFYITSTWTPAPPPPTSTPDTHTR